MNVEVSNGAYSDPGSIPGVSTIPGLRGAKAKVLIQAHRHKGTKFFVW